MTIDLSQMFHIQPQPHSRHEVEGEVGHGHARLLHGHHSPVGPGYQHDTPLPCPPLQPGVNL